MIEEKCGVGSVPEEAESAAERIGMRGEARADLAGAVRGAFALKEADIRSYSPLTLAYIGDSIYDIIIRTVLVERSNAQVNKLHKKASNYVKAQAQKDLYHAVEEDLSEEERGVFKRGRNAKSATAAKNASISDYRTATGMEALFGYLYLTGRTGRIFELIQKGFPQLCGESGAAEESGTE